MTNNQINIAIAEEFGWSLEKTEQGGKIIYPNGFANEFTPFSWALEKFCNTIPNYCNDLNAMHEAIMSLEGPNRDHSFRRALAKSVGAIGFEDWEHSLVCLDKLTNATARQRAEAFLRTIGKWEEAAK